MSMKMLQQRCLLQMKVMISSKFLNKLAKKKRQNTNTYLGETLLVFKGFKNALTFLLATDFFTTL